MLKLSMHGHTKYKSLNNKNKFVKMYDDTKRKERNTKSLLVYKLKHIVFYLINPGLKKITHFPNSLCIISFT